MNKILGRYTHCTHFLPALIVLFFGMIALHATVRLADTHALLEAQHETAKTQDSLSQAYIQKFMTMEQEEERLHVVLYWSVIAISFSGFLLFVLNADKLVRLEKMNAERIEALHDLEYRSAAVEAALEGIGIVDKAGNLKYINKALMELHDIQPHEKSRYIDKNWFNLYTPKGRDYLAAIVLPELKRVGYWRGISPIVRQDGQVVRADMSLTLLEDGGFIGTARDITAEDQAAREKREMQDQLYQAQKMEAIGRLAGGIAHDFNNILAAMNGYAEFLVDDLDEKSQQHTFARNILQAGRQARSLVDKILAFSRRNESDVAVIDVAVPLEESLSMLRASMPKSIELETDILLQHAPIEGSSTQIAQVIMNLCVNASDAMEKDKGRLLVGLKKVYSTDDAPLDWLSESLPRPDISPLIRIDDISPGHTRLLMGQLVRDCDYICLSVSDTGCGMSRVIMEHIFEPFFTTKPVDKGTGLGLSTVHGVVTAHSGAMMVKSVVGEGTVFELYFPMAAGDAKIEVTDTINADVATVAKILLVEDQIEVRDMTFTMLERMGYQVDTATNGLEALDILREKPGYHELVLTDQNMPKMTGLELVYQAHEDFPDLVFVMLSGYSQEKLQELMAEHPAIHAVIRKPIAQNTLGQILSQVLAAKALRSKVA